MNSNEIKARFGRGRKWVLVPSEHEIFILILDKCKAIDFLNDTADRFVLLDKAYVRFSSASKSSEVLFFTIHKNTSAASNVKIPIRLSDALTLQVLNGTPKSCGYEKSEKGTKNNTLSNKCVKDEEAVVSKSIISFNEPQTEDEWETWLKENNLSIDDRV